MGKFFKLDVIKGTMLLTLFAFLGKALSAIFRIGLSYIVGSYGMGLYQLAFPLLVFFVVFSSEGFSLSLTIKIAEDKNGSVKRAYFKHAIKFCAIFSGVSAVALCVFSGFLSRLQGSKLSVFVYFIIAIGVLCVSLLSVIKAYIRGQENYKLYSISEVLEDFLKVLFSLVLALIGMPYGVEYAVSGVFVGIILSSLCSMLFVLFGSKKTIPAAETRLLTRQEKRDYNIFAIVTMGSAIIVPAIGFLESATIVGLLMKAGSTAVDATRLFGLSRGSVSALINLPFFVLASIETILLPNLARAKNGGIYYKKTRASLLFAVFVSFPFVLLFSIFPTQVVELLYGGALSFSEITIASNLLRLGAVGILFSSISSIISVLLNSNNMAVAPFFASLMAGVLKLVALFVLVPKMSIYGAEIASVLFSVFYCAVVLIVAFKKRLFWAPKKIVAIMAIWGIVFSIVYAVYTFIMGWIKGAALACVLAFACVGIIIAIGVVVVMAKTPQKFMGFCKEFFGFGEEE